MAREFPIHNGRMTTDLDANGHKIKNLPPGSGFTQVQSDWGQADATAPDFIKNKPPIPAPVTIDPALSPTSENPVQNKVVAEALYTGFTEWVVVPSTYGGESLWLAWSSANNRWKLLLGNRIVGEKVVGHDVTSITFNYPEDTDIDVAVTATRHLVTPTKTSQLTNDGDGTNAFVKTNDTRLEDERTPTAHTHAMADVTGLGTALSKKANASDLPYRMVTPGEWQFSGLPNGVTAVMQYVGGNSWEITLSNGDHQSNGSSGENAMSVEFPASEWMEGIATYPVTATRPSLPGHLLDRAGNLVVVTGATTLTLPAANPGYLRDFLVRLEISGSTVPTITFQGQGSEAPNGADEITYETDGDEFPVPDEAGTWSYSFTENCVAHKFAVSLKKVNEVAAPQAQGGS